MIDLPYLSPEKLLFSTLDNETLKEISVKCLTNPTSLDRLGTPLSGGLYDPALGPSDRNEVCQTCKQFSTNCPGHFGHIQLPLPVFNPIYFSYLVAILKACCFACYRIICKDYESHVLSLQICAIRSGNISCSESISELAAAISSQTKEKVDGDAKGIKKLLLEENASAAILETIKSETNDLFNSMVKESDSISEFDDSTAEYLTDMLSRLLRTLGFRKVCPHCRAPVRDVIIEGNTKIYLKPLGSKTLEAWDISFKKQSINEVNSNSPWHRVTQTILLTPSVAMAFLNKVYNRDLGVCKMLLNGTNPSTMFFNIICVPPVKFRPISVVNGRKYDNVISNKLSGVIAGAVQLSTLLQEQKAVSLDKSISDTDNVEKFREIQAVWLKIQTDVNQFVGMLKAQLEKKTGLFRMHMMGKRVNYAARSVISPDPNINCDEIGIPLVFATKLTYPQPVTPWNVVELRRAVVNGPLKYPGATHVEMEDGKRVILRADNKNQRESIAKQLLVEDHKRIGYNKKVCRHVKDGDILLLNRQPTLHRVSIMAHKARVLSNEKTLRLHYSVCKSYNADFDGDEMNAHLLQDELSRSEACTLMSVNDQFLAPKDGKPLGGLIQDHTVAATLLTQRGRFFTKAEYVEFIYQGLGDCPRRIVIEPPAILKPQKLWSGKQVITTLIKTIVPPHRSFLSLIGKCTTPEKCWVNSSDVNHAVDVSDLADSQVIIYNGELLSGVVDKSQCGSKDFGLVHCVFELYGGEVATQLLSAFGRLFTAFLHWRGFTLGIEDVTVQLHGEEERREILKFCSGKGDEIACKVLNVDAPSDLSTAYQQAHLNPLPFKDLSALDRAMRPETGKIETEVSRACMGINLWKKFPANNLQLMVRSGAKGSEVNCVQISCMVGQVELEGARPPLMFSGRTLPSFLPYDPSLSAGGFITSRFATGIKPQEMFFNCMAGREGLVDTAVKTSRSGYLQRCLIKHLEGICTSYDHTVRDSDGSIIQFLYGYDGIDITKANFLSPAGLKYLKSNAGILPALSKNEKRFLDFKAAPEYVKSMKLEDSKKKSTGFLVYEKKMRKKDMFKSISNIRNEFRSPQDKAILESWAVLNASKKRKWELKSGSKRHLPVLSTFSPHRYYGSVSERLYREVGKLRTGNANKDSIEQTILLHALRGLSHPGDGVGVLAGQSIGEPSTQMTLNTFHFAGRADMNITMGIPRLRELLLTRGASMKTPMSQFPLKLGTSQSEAKQLAKMLSQVRLSQVLEKVDIVESMFQQGSNIIKRYRIKFHLLPEEYYTDKCYCTSKQALDFIEDTFITRLRAEFTKRRREQTSLAAVKEDNNAPAPSVAKKEEDDDDEVDDEREEKNITQASDYEDEGDDDADQDVSVLPQIKQEEEEDEEEEETKLDRRQMAILKKKSVAAYEYDKRNSRWCEVALDFAMTGSDIMMTSVIRDMADKVLVWSIPGIKRAFVNNDVDDKGRWVIITDGINILELWKHHNIIDINDIYMNDINKFCEFYGVEAAMEALVKEISGVFGAYGIKVDNRHLSLVGDYVTHFGGYRPFNRTGIRESSSLLQKVTFETSMEFLRRAAVYNESDTLSGPSSCIVMGKVGNYGTGACQIRYPLS